MNLDYRHLGREQALNLLYESEMKGVSPMELAQKLPMAPEENVLKILEGVQKNQKTIDELILRFAEGWELERMPLIDLAIMRIAVYELQKTDVPPNVVLNEAVELSKEYSTLDSGRFVNGVLASVLKETS